MARELGRQFENVALTIIPTGIGIAIGGLLFGNAPLIYIGGCAALPGIVLAIAYRCGLRRRR